MLRQWHTNTVTTDRLSRADRRSESTTVMVRQAGQTDRQTVMEPNEGRDRKLKTVPDLAQPDREACKTRRTRKGRQPDVEV